MRIRLFNLFLVIALVAICFSSCKQTTLQILQGQEANLLAKYIAKYHPDVKPKTSGLYFIETKAAPAGTDTIKIGDLVKVYYTGYLIEDDAAAGIRDGYKFDMSGEFEPFSFTVGSSSVITGWDEALLYMKAGSEAKLVVPSKLAYSSQQQSTIPAYSTLVFYIKVYKVYKSTDVWPTIEIRPKN
ncbi:MAG: FKBP-type peptidyl-prolyl cis-trans isomerase [Mariniphaga sp.]